MTPVICEKGHRNNPLTEEQKQSNRQKSKTRCRVEHIFGFIEGSMNGSFVRSIGIIRAKAATNTSRSLSPLWDNCVLSSKNQVK